MKPHVVLCVGGGIAAFKSASLCSMLMKAGYSVEVLMTEHATHFIQPLTFQAITHRRVFVDTFLEQNPEEISHIAVADRATLIIVAPATANVIGKLAHGIADDMVSTTLLATSAPVVLAPAMNVHMYQHPAVQQNLEILRERGVIVVEPAAGPLACGYTGKGRLPEPEDLVGVVAAVLNQKKDLAGIRVTVTAGPTIEDIDPVRYLSNASSGKMGYAIAEVARSRGAVVKLISGPTHLPRPTGVEFTSVRSTNDMLTAVGRVMQETDVFISAAAPADFRPKTRYDEKWKKQNGIPTLELEGTPDILATMAVRKQPWQTFVGFAAETTELVAHARRKLTAKNLDMVVANNVTEPGAGFGGDTNRVTLVLPEDERPLPLMTKQQVAEEIFDVILQVRMSGVEA